MNRLTELEFVNSLSLRNRKQHSKGYNFSCSICNDKKRRGYILIDYQKITIMCHNCGFNTNLKKYIELYEPSLFDEYRIKEKQEFIENLKLGTTVTKQQEYNASIVNSNIDNLTLFKFNEKYFIPAIENKECIEYCNKRKIPEEIIKTLKYCRHPNSPCSDMLIFPFYWKDNIHVYGFQGRSLKDKRFYIHSKNDSFKVEGIFQVDLEQPVYIFESIIDRYVMKNSIAVMGSDISTQVLSMIKKPVFCFDNDKAGILKSLKYATMNHKVFIWETGNKAKDTNELLTKYKWNVDTISNMIERNVYDELSAIVRLKLKLRNRKS